MSEPDILSVARAALKDGIMYRSDYLLLAQAVIDLSAALEKLSTWPPSYPANETIERMRKFSAATLEAK